MPSAFAPLAIELTDEESLLAARIDFDFNGSYNGDSWRPVADAMEELTNSLRARGAIPEARRKYLTDPEYFVGGHKKSRLQSFEKNGTKGEAIFRHPHFVKYLRYVLYGPDLPSAVIKEFQRKIADCGEPFTTGDANDLSEFARGLARFHNLDKNKAPEEFFKLTLDCGLDVWDARAVRTSVMQMRG